MEEDGVLGRRFELEVNVPGVGGQNVRAVLVEGELEGRVGKAEGYWGGEEG